MRNGHLPHPACSLQFENNAQNLSSFIRNFVRVPSEPFHSTVICSYCSVSCCVTPDQGCSSGMKKPSLFNTPCFPGRSTWHSRRGSASRTPFLTVPGTQNASHLCNFSAEPLAQLIQRRSCNEDIRVANNRTGTKLDLLSGTWNRYVLILFGLVWYSNI